MIFDEYRDSATSLSLTKLISGGFFLLALFLSITSQITNNLFFYLAGSSAVIFLIAQTEKEAFKEWINANFFGNKNAMQIVLFVMGGALIGIFVGGLTRSGEYNLVLPIQAINLGNLNFLFVNIVAPLLEPLFWRAFIFPTASAMMILAMGEKNKTIASIIALLLSASAFGYYHVATYYSQTGTFTGTIDQITFAAFFAILFTLGVYLTSCIGVEIGWHFVNNLFAAGYPTAEIYPTILVFGIAFAGLAWFAERLGGD